MGMPIYQEALNVSAYEKDLIVTPVSNGLINQTYKVTANKSGFKFILQRINRYVFPEPGKVQENYKLIWKYLEEVKMAENNACFLNIPDPLPFVDDSFLFCDSHDQYWRKFEFIDKSVNLQHADKISQVKKTVRTFACITRTFDAFDHKNLHITIPGFHDLSLRFRQFKQSLHTRLYDRLIKASSIIEQLKKREHYASFYEIMTESSSFKKRLTHHDAKISNILFDEETGNVICPVDFDTCMPGYFFSDPGDMIRSMAVTEDENCTEPEKIFVNKDFYEAIINEYLDVMGERLTDAEKKHIHYSGLLIIYMQSLRFLTDYLNGDIYYKTTSQEQNFDRAINQFTFLKKLEEYLSEKYKIR